MSRSVTERRALVEPQNSPLSLSRQCQLLALPRSSFYYRPVELDARTIQVMHAMDRICTDHPFYGFRRVQEALRRQGFEVNHKRVRRLMQRMGLQAVYPTRRLSAPGDEHRIYPYLLRGVPIERPDQVWSSDITYLPLRVLRCTPSDATRCTLDVIECTRGWHRSVPSAPHVWNAGTG